MAIDPIVELEVMQGVAAELKKLEGEVPPTRRVLEWAVSRFLPELRIVTYTPASAEDVAVTPGKGISMPSGEAKQWDSLPELFSAVTPSSDPERALVVAYWMQKVQGDQDFDGFSVNKELRHLGYAASNITSALTQLIVRKPALVLQTHKSGSSKQARKRYRLTNEGLRSVERMLQGGSLD
jgi:hypothetical protein